MRRFLCCTALLLVACEGSLSENEDAAKTADANSPSGSKTSRAGTGGRGQIAEGGSGSSGTTSKPRTQGQAGANDGSGGDDGDPNTTEETGGAGGDTSPGGGTGGSNASGSGGSGQAGDPMFPEPMKDPDGFTALTKSVDSRVIYVSTSGNDSNDGLSEDKPMKTPATALKKLRDGYPDWVLFKRGDTFEGAVGNFVGSGRSETEPMVIGAYGDGARPLFRATSSPLYIINDSHGSPHHDHVWFIGLSFYAARRDPSSPDFSGNPTDVDGIHWRVGTTDLLFEDCVFRFFGVNATFQDGDKLGMSGIRLRRNQFLDSYNTESVGHSQGIYMSALKGILIEENIFDHNGWNDDVDGAQKMIFNHHIYVDNGNTGVVAKNNIFLRSSSHGLMLRPGGIASGNLFVYDAISLLVGGGNNPEAGGVDGEATDNVILHGTDIGNMPKQYGIDLENIHSVKIGNNIVANSSTNQASSGLKMSVTGATYTDNIVYNWPLGKNMTGSYSDPNRDLATYDATLGGPGTFDHFVEGLRAQSQQSWRTEYMAQTINAYIREGFAP